MNILVRLPNWLGDMVMATGFLQALQEQYPNASIDAIVKKGLDPLVAFMPNIAHHYVFDKNEWKGLKGAYTFGKKISKEKQYDFFFCLPDSFSSACMAYGTKAKQRIGFKKELRSIFLTKSFAKPVAQHRVDEYISLLEQFSQATFTKQKIHLATNVQPIASRVIVNFNSEAVSRRMPVPKAASILNALLQAMPTKEFVCIGSAKEKEHINAILQQVGNPAQVINKAGETKNLTELIELIATGSAILTTDSGPAHVANALNVPTVVLFGAGNENNTSPYNKEQCTIIRLGQLPCEPCISNTCKLFGIPKCLELLEENKIVSAVKSFGI